MNAFSRLGLVTKLELSEEEIREAFRIRAAETHPDLGGSEEDFSKLREAQECLLSPSKRLREWLILKEEKLDERGTIDGDLMDLFTQIAQVIETSEATIRASAEARSALTQSLAEVRRIAERQKIQGMLSEVEKLILEHVSLFPQMQESIEQAPRVLRNLIFLEKWRSTLMSLYGRLL